MNNSTLDLVECHNLAFKALMRFLRNEEAPRGLRPKQIDGDKRVRYLKRLLLSQGKYCYWCDCELNKIENDEQGMSMDHVIPRMWGGPNHIDNLVLSCRKCDMHRETKGELKKEIFAFYGLTEEEVNKYND